jgi:hypothetical protein
MGFASGGSLLHGVPADLDRDAARTAYPFDFSRSDSFCCPVQIGKAVQRGADGAHGCSLMRNRISDLKVLCRPRLLKRVHVFAVKSRRVSSGVQQVETELCNEHFSAVDSHTSCK